MTQLRIARQLAHLCTYSKTGLLNISRHLSSDCSFDGVASEFIILHICSTQLAIAPAAQQSIEAAERTVYMNPWMGSYRVVRQYSSKGHYCYCAPNTWFSEACFHSIVTLIGSSWLYKVSVPGTDVFESIYNWVLRCSETCSCVTDHLYSETRYHLVMSQQYAF